MAYKRIPEEKSSPILQYELTKTINAIDTMAEKLVVKHLDNLGGTRQLDTAEDVFGSPEGSVNLYYGRIRQGKSYGATADLIEELAKGRLVYATWPVKLENFDDRRSWFRIVWNFLTFNKIYYRISCADNFHYIDAEKGLVDGKKEFNPEYPKQYIEYLNKLNHCSLYLDEAWRVIDSYQGTNFGIEGRNLILVTGHKFRTVNLIAQRPTSIHVTARGNVNRFYKFEKIMTWPWIRFQRSEYQDMKGETVDEEQEPISVKRYWASKKIFNSYNSYYYGDLEPLHKKQFEKYHLTFIERLTLISHFFRGEKKIKLSYPQKKLEK